MCITDLTVTCCIPSCSGPLAVAVKMKARLKFLHYWHFLVLHAAKRCLIRKSIILSSAPPYVVVAWCLVSTRDNFTFLYYFRAMC
jgi:hypothetical protein